MRVLKVDEARRIMAGHTELRVSDIPPEGLLLVPENIILSSNREGEITLFALDPHDTE